MAGITSLFSSSFIYDNDFYTLQCVSYAQDRAAIPRQRLKSPLAASEVATPVATALPQASR
jgi:hypothetical protein